MVFRAKETDMATDMPVVKGAFGDTPQIEFPSEQAPQGLKVVELEASRSLGRDIDELDALNRRLDEHLNRLR